MDQFELDINLYVMILKYYNIYAIENRVYSDNLYALYDEPYKYCENGGFLEWYGITTEVLTKKIKNYYETVINGDDDYYLNLDSHYKNFIIYLTREYKLKSLSI